MGADSDARPWVCRATNDEEVLKNLLRIAGRLRANSRPPPRNLETPPFGQSTYVGHARFYALWACSQIDTNCAVCGDGSVGPIICAIGLPVRPVPYVLGVYTVG